MLQAILVGFFFFLLYIDTLSLYDAAEIVENVAKIVIKQWVINNDS